MSLLQRITIPEILEDEWFKKGYKPPNFEQIEGVSLDDVDAVFNDSQVIILLTFSSVGQDHAQF